MQISTQYKILYKQEMMKCMYIVPIYCSMIQILHKMYLKTFKWLVLKTKKVIHNHQTATHTGAWVFWKEDSFSEMEIKSNWTGRLQHATNRAHHTQWCLWYSWLVEHTCLYFGHLSPKKLFKCLLFTTVLSVFYILSVLLCGFQSTWSPFTITSTAYQLWLVTVQCQE